MYSLHYLGFRQQVQPLGYVSLFRVGFGWLTFGNLYTKLCYILGGVASKMGLSKLDNSFNPGVNLGVQLLISHDVA